MSYYDLQDLRHRICTLGENIRQQENFYGDINEFLHQVYQSDRKAEHKSLLPPLSLRVTSKRELRY